MQEQPAARRGRHPLWSLLDSPCTPGINDWAASCFGGEFSVQHLVPSVSTEPSCRWMQVPDSSRALSRSF